MFNYQGILNHQHYGQRIGVVREVRACMGACGRSVFSEVCQIYSIAFPMSAEALEVSFQDVQGMPSAV